MDLDKLSDAELESLASGKPIAPKAQAFNLDDLSDDELAQLAGEKSLEEPSLLEKFGKGALDSAVKVGQFVDSYTGAPTRAAIGAVQDSKNPLKAFVDQFGADPTKAPTGKEIMTKAGVSTEETLPLPFVQKSGTGLFDRKAGQPFQAGEAVNVSPAGVSGFALDVAADPTNVLPLAAGTRFAAKGAESAAKGTSALAKATAQLAKRGIEAAPGGRTTVKALEAAAEAPKAVKQALEYVFKPTQDKDFARMVAVAEKNGIDPSLLPESVEFGDSSFISRASRNLREGPLGQPELERFEQGYQAVQQAANNQIARIGGGAPLSPIEAGGTIRQGYNDAVDRLFDNVDFTYNSVISQAPGIRLTDDSAARVASKLNGIEKWAKGRLQRGITNTDRGQAEQILRAVEAARAGNGSLKQTYEAMSEIGRHAFKKSKNSLADTPVDVKKMQDLYFTLRDEFLESTAAQLGDDVANALIDSNNQITMFNANKKHVADLIGNDSLADERLFNSLVFNGDSKRLSALKEILTPEQLRSVKGSVLENLVKRDPDGAFNFGTLHSAMRNKRNVLESLFEPEEIVAFGELVKLGDRFGSAVLSSSGTGASNLFSNLLKGVGDNTLTRSVVSSMKESARGRAVMQSAPPPALLPPASIAAPGPFQRPVRNKAEETAKLMQVLGTLGTGEQKEEQAAVQRRLQEIINKRLAK